VTLALTSAVLVAFCWLGVFTDLFSDWVEAWPVTLAMTPAVMVVFCVARGVY
jgi:hypothetical protein